MMIVIPVEEGTLPLIAALNGGVRPKIDPLEHSSFIYHGEDTPPELVPTVLIGTLMGGGDFQVVETRFAYKE
jgi:hypothetical protein